MSKGIADIDDDQHMAIRKAICPGCKFDLPDMRESRPSGGQFVHSLPGTDFSMTCKANSYREARVNAREAAGEDS